MPSRIIIFQSEMERSIGNLKFFTSERLKMERKRVTNKRIVAFVGKQKKYWEPVKFGSKYYVMTFQNNVYEWQMNKGKENE